MTSTDIGSIPDSTDGGGRATRRPGRMSVWISYVILTFVIGVVVCANFISPHSPTEQSLEDMLMSPSWSHWLGTDDLGRDVLSRMLYGTRTSFLAAGFAVAIAVAVGLPLGVISGYFSGMCDAIVMRLVDSVLAFPAIVLSIAITASLGPNIITAMASVGIVMVPIIVRLARAQTMSVKNETYIDAARSYGARGFRRMIGPHILPNIIQPILVQIAILMGFALIAEASLSFLQLGVQPPDPSWGAVLSRSYTFLDQAPLQIFIPGLAIAATVFSLNIMGDEIQRLLDPRRR